jgi:RHS repeat-associated protein
MWVSSSSSNLSISGSTPTTSSFYNTANNHFTAVNYDNAGNQTSKLYPTTSTFAYDAESRQKSTYSNTNGTSTYAYSGDGHRVTKVALGATITYVYDALGRLAAEYSTAEGVPDCTTCYIVDDHLGDTRLVLDESANVVSCHDYQPFGAEVPDVNGRTTLWGAADAVNQKFTGKERDLETNFDYFGARYYGYLQGRFTSPDWAAKAEAIPYADPSYPQTLNLYSYVQNNPLAHPDADGHCCDLADVRAFVNETEGLPLPGAKVLGLAGTGLILLMDPDVRDGIKNFVENPPSLSSTCGGGGRVHVRGSGQHTSLFARQTTTTRAAATERAKYERC